MTSVLAAAALGFALAEADRGVREEKPNWGARVKQYLAAAGIKVPAPWCAAFVQYVTDATAKFLGVPNPLDGVNREALVADYFTWAQENEAFIDRPEPGDLALFAFGKGWDHIGIVVRPPDADGVFWSVEGNTNAGGSREGVEVAVKKNRDADSKAYKVRFVRWV